MIQGAQDAASEHGHLLMVVNSGLDNELEKHEIRALKQHQVDGIIYARMYNQLVSVPEELQGMPTIVLDATTDNPELSSVVPDEFGAGESAAGLLVEAGHRRIGMINNEDDIPAAHGRLAGFRAGLERHGLGWGPANWCPPIPVQQEAGRLRSACCPERTGPQRCSASTTRWRWAPTRPPATWA
ncbi:hypothetical protein [Arthrobacter nitrophenolicus]|uniref:hypothetical protein n=1 Tax=Arthrobacter nitrophenolicus TaxID=683150 RepID=UPI00034534D0